MKLTELRLLAVLAASLTTGVCHGQRLTPEQTGGVYYAYPIAPEASNATASAASNATVSNATASAASNAAAWATNNNPASGTVCSFPDGFEVFYVSHYGRHGSRWLPDEGRYEWVNSQFADNSNLTTLGRSVKKRLKKIWKNARGNAGQLTPLGAKQHRGIARRMVERCPAAFAPGAMLRARSSIVPRCRASMLAFCEGVKDGMRRQEAAATKQLQRTEASPTIVPETDIRFMSYINHESEEVKALSAKTKRLPDIGTDRFISALFKDGAKVKEPKKLLSELHTIAADMQDIPLKVSLWDIFTHDEMMAVHDANNERMTIINGDTLLNDGIPARSSIALWENIAHEADSIIAAGGHGASLRFGHDTALYRLLTLLRLSLPGTGMEQIVPMAANLQMVFARNGEGRVLVAFLHNERLQRLPIADTGGCYDWGAVKDYMARRTHRLEHLWQLSALNTMVGTAPANTRTAGLFGKGSEEHGQTLPAVLVPHGQTFWTPQTRDTEKKCVAPYYYTDSLFQGIRASHWLVGGCTQDYGSFTVAALRGRLRLSPAQRATRFSHSDETSHPYYYAVRLPDEQLLLELTGSSHSAMLRVTPLADGPVHLVVNHNSDEGQGTARVDTINKQVYLENPVHRIYQGWGEPAGFSGHLVLTYTDETVDFCTDDRGVALSFEGRRGVPLVFAMATSFTSAEGAALNLAAERGTFEEMEQRCIDRWTERLHTIDVTDEDSARVKQFYGALYRASFLPREMSDADGKYVRFSAECIVHSAECRVHNAECIVHSAQPHLSLDTCHLSLAPSRRYGDFSMWDTYRALHPLLTIIAPQQSAEMMQSLVGMYEEGGWLPIFPCWNSYTAAMIGDHCSSVLADAWVKGIRGFDGGKAYEAMRKNAMEWPENDDDYKNGMGRRALQSYVRYGYIPLEDSVKEAFHQQEQTSRTLEYAYDDFCVAQMAKALGHNADYSMLLARSRNWRNVINPLTGYADGRHADGSWEGNTDLVHRKPYITEGATCHYTWYVPHDIDRLIQLMGGSEAFTQKLDSMFTQRRYWHGNEPCHQVPWLFTLAGHPEKTRQWVRHILDTEYNDSPGGLSGNDDAGQMSAWQIFASLGFYPVCPGTPVYVVGEPLFRRVTINSPGGKPFVIDRNAKGERPLTITHNEIVNGGRMGRKSGLNDN